MAGVKRTFFWRKLILFRIFRSLPARERLHVMEVLPKKHAQLIP